MGSCCPGQAGCLQILPSWVLPASLNTQSCGQASLMATDYCFLKFICVRKSFKKHFPHLSLCAPAHQTKPPMWFSIAVNFSGLISTRLQGGKQQLRSVQFSILCLTASCQDLAWFAEPSPFEVLFSSFLALQMLSGPPRLRTRFVRQRGQTRVTDAIAERRTVITRLGNYERCAEEEISVAGAVLTRRYLGSVAAPDGAAAVPEQGWPQGTVQMGAVSRGEHPAGSAGATVTSWNQSLLVLVGGFMLLWWSLIMTRVGRGMLFSS